MIKIATYNIQFSLHPMEISKNLLRLTKTGVSIICLQEVVDYGNGENIVNLLLQKLGPDWRAINHLGNKPGIANMGNCIIWNSRKLQLVNHQKVLLPYSKKLTFFEKGLSWLAGGITVPFKRRALIGYFAHQNNLLRVTNIHLDHNGGIKNRTRQLAFVRRTLQRKKPVDHDIICGDFNNLDLRNTQHGLQTFQKILQGYEDATAHLSWSADLYLIDTSLGSKLVHTLIRKLNFHLKRKLDFIWVKNATFSGSKIIQATGSDHMPLVTSVFL